MCERFLGFAAAHDVIYLDQVTSGLIRRFETAPGRDRHGRRSVTPAPGSERQRRGALRTLFADCRSMGLTTAHPLLDAPAIPRSPRRPAQQITDAEVAKLRFHAGYGAPRSRYAALLALLLAGQASAEIACATTADLDTPGARISTAGSTHTLARSCPLDDWSLQALAQRAARLADIGPGPHPLVTTASSAYRAQASVGAGFSVIARRAGLSTAKRQVRLRDVTAYRGQQVFAQTGRLSEVARVLGLTSLDAAAATIGYDWLAGPGNGEAP
ncbi:hypothetical protein OG607_26395 [Streptomyces sp. NBC_01537]|uniref:hypothetical protein n=1 Tax=Streptomyces sp. NBC_01537 TaxID=2903896 RepID=UPI00386A8B1F